MGAEVPGFAYAAQGKEAQAGWSRGVPSLQKLLAQSKRLRRPPKPRPSAALREVEGVRVLGCNFPWG